MIPYGTCHADVGLLGRTDIRLEDDVIAALEATGRLAARTSRWTSTRVRPGSAGPVRSYHQKQMAPAEKLQNALCGGHPDARGIRDGRTDGEPVTT